MRIIYPEELNKEAEIFIPYIERVDIDKLVFKEGTPESVKQHYEHYIRETKRLREYAL